MIVRRVCLSLLLPIVAAANACMETSRAPRPEVTRTDSAGIEIVVSAGPAWTAEEAWRLADEPSLDLPSIDANGTRHFYNVSAAHRFADGRVVISDWRAKRLRFYGPGGDFLNSGAQPAGPGRFATIIGFVVGPGDSLAVYDLHSNATVLGPNGEYVRRLSLPGERILRSELRSWKSGGEFCAVGSELTGTRRRDHTVPTPDFWINSIPFCFDEETPVTAVDSMPSQFASYAGPVFRAYSFPVGDVEGWSSFRTPFTTDPSVVAHGDAIFVAPGVEAEVHVRRIGGEQPGTLDRIFRFQETRTPTTAELLEQFLDKVEERSSHYSSDTEHYRTYLAALREAELPDSVSSIRKLLVDQPGNLWLSHPWPDEGEWTVLDPDGVWLGSVVIPDGMKPLEIGDDWMLVRTQEVDEVHSVRLYDLVKPTRIR